MNPERILVVVDEPRYLRLIEFNLTAEGYSVQTAATGEEAVLKTAQDRFDLVVLDIMLPGIDGFETLSQIREFSHVSVIMLTARGRDEDKVRGLRLGADDYVTKPFSAQELLARVGAVLRRSISPDGNGLTGTREYGALQIDFARHRVVVHGSEVSLTPTEYRLLRQLAANAGRVMVQDDLIETVWGSGYDSDVLRMTVRRLRQKLENDPSNPTLIKNVLGIGYLLDTAGDG